MADSIDHAHDYMAREEAARAGIKPQPFAVSWLMKDGTQRAIILPDLTTLHGARLFLEEEKGVDPGEEPWCIVYRRDDDIVATGHKELKEKTIAVFVEKENLVPC